MFRRRVRSVTRWVRTHALRPPILVLALCLYGMAPGLRGAVFADVPEGYPAQREIEATHHKQVVTACSTQPLRYCPSRFVTRIQLAASLGSAVHGPGWNPPDHATIFADVPDGSLLEDWATQSLRDGLIAECAPATANTAGRSHFCPDQVVTRKDIASMLLRAKWGPTYAPPPAVEVLFDDVKPADPLAPWIHELVREGIAAGCTPARYCPDEPVSREALAVFMTRAFQLLLTRVEVPASAVSASTTGAASRPGDALDGKHQTAWVAAGFPSQWIAVDTGALRPIAKVELLVTQLPHGATTHKVYVSADGINWDSNPDNATSPDPAVVIERTLLDSQGLTVDVREYARYIRIETSQSPSHVGWREIRIFEDPREALEQVRNIRVPEHIAYPSSRFTYALENGRPCRYPHDQFYLCVRYQTLGEASPIASVTGYDASVNTGLGPLPGALQRGPFGGTTPQSTYQISGTSTGVFMRSTDSDFPVGDGIQKHTVFQYNFGSPPLMYSLVTEADDFTNGLVLQADLTLHQFEQYRIPSGPPRGLIAGQYAMGAYFEDPSGQTIQFVFMLYDSRPHEPVAENVAVERGVGGCNQYVATSLKRDRLMYYSTVQGDSGGDFYRSPWPGSRRFFRVYVTPRNLKRAISRRNALCPAPAYPQLNADPLLYRVRSVFINQEVFYNDPGDAWTMGASITGFGVYELKH